MVNHGPSEMNGAGNYKVIQWNCQLKIGGTEVRDEQKGSQEKSKCQFVINRLTGYKTSFFALRFTFTGNGYIDL